MHRAGTRTVLITGASSGIGRACALRLARRGDTVFGTTRRSVDAVEDELQSLLPGSRRIHLLTMDVQDEASVTSAVGEVLGRAGRLDAVVNNAGVGIAGAVEETADEEALSILNTNLLGVLRVCRAALPAMRTQGGGTIVNISSIAGRIGLPYQGLYSATKFALEGLTEALRMEVRPFGIRVALVEPGDVHTAFTDRRVLVRAAVANSPYRTGMDRTLSIVEADERGGASPDTVARCVERVICRRHPKVRYTVGPLSQRLAAELKRMLPATRFEGVLSRYYRVPRRQGRGEV